MTERNVITIGLIADIHHGKNRDTLISEPSIATLAAFVDSCNARQVDIVVDLGDRINDIDATADSELLLEVAAEFKRLKMPRLHVLGNHDVKHLKRHQMESLLETSLTHQVMDVKGWRLILVQAPHALVADTDALKWLNEQLSQSRAPTLIFTHVVPSGESMIGNYWFHDYESRRNDRENIISAQRIIHTHGQVVAVIGGHRHWNSWTTIDGTHYLTQQCLADTFVTTPQPASAWGILELTEKLTWQVYGNDPLRLELSIKELGRHWIDPIKLV